MRSLLLSLIFLYYLPFPLLAAGEPGKLAFLQEPSPQVVITSPQPGQALQGSVPITGNTAVPGYLSAELSFAYALDPTNTWFLIQKSTLPISDGTLLQWDTTTISDGNYTLRLVVSLEDGSQAIVTIAGLRVRNYTPIETPTQTPAVPTATPQPGEALLPTSTIAISLTPTPTLQPPAPSPLPTNPAELSGFAITQSMGIGALITLGLFALLGLYLFIRQALYRHD